MHNKVLMVIVILFFVCLLTVPLSALAEEHHAGGFSGNRTVVVRSTPGWGWGGWGNPFWGGFYPYYTIDNRGKVKIKGADKYDQVFLNGAYAGTVEKVKSIRLDPGKYSIQVRQQGRDLVNRAVYVITGKTVEIHVNPDLNE
jgi:hypothetical protein